MKYLIIGLLFSACGIKPMTEPYGCRGDWVCVCDSDRNCEWEIRCES